MPPLKREMSGEELSQLEERRREEALNEAFLYKPRRTPTEKKTVGEREEAAEKTANEQMNQWAELQAYLPYIFLGDPSRYDRLRNP